MGQSPGHFLTGGGVGFAQAGEDQSEGTERCQRLIATQLGGLEHVE